MKYLEDIKQALIKKGAKGNITKDSDFSELGLDSLDLMDMIVELENKIGMQVSDQDLMSIKTVDNLLTVIDKEKK